MPGGRGGIEPASRQPGVLDGRLVEPCGRRPSHDAMPSHLGPPACGSLLAGMGQTKPVHVVRYIAANSIEERILKLQLGVRSL